MDGIEIRFHISAFGADICFTIAASREKFLHIRLVGNFPGAQDPAAVYFFTAALGTFIHTHFVYLRIIYSENDGLFKAAGEKKDL